MSDFEREYRGDFLAPDPKRDVAMRIWARYHVDCEAYDRTVCTGTDEREGCAMPRDGHERGLMLRNASERERLARAQIEANGIDVETSLSARRKVNGMRPREQEAWAAMPLPEAGALAGGWART